MTMNECNNDDVRDLLPLLASGGQVESPAAVEAHIAGCEACRAELALLKAARQALLRAPVVDVARIGRAVPAYSRTARTDPGVIPIESRRTRTAAWRIAAAGLIVAAAGSALVVRQAGDGPPTSVVAAADTALSVGQGGAAGVTRGDTTNALSMSTDSGAPAIVGTRSGDGTQMTFGGGLDDLSEEDLVALLAELEEGVPLTEAEPEEAFPSMTVDGEEET
jgi:anti-sigma factor RsiW